MSFRLTLISFSQLERGESWVIITASIFAGLALVTIFFIIFQPKSKEELTFAVSFLFKFLVYFLKFSIEALNSMAYFRSFWEKILKLFE